MHNQEWADKIRNNFDNAAVKYLDSSNIQRVFAKKIVLYLKELNHFLIL